MKIPVPESLFNKVAGLRPATLLKKRLWYKCFPMNFAKFSQEYLSYKTPLDEICLKEAINLILSEEVTHSFQKT